MNSPSDKIWAYLHNELNAEKKEDFEQALQGDPSLRKAFENRFTTHAELKEMLTLPDEETLSDEELTEKLMAEWAAEHPEHLDEPEQKQKRKTLYFTLPLAAAAALIVLLALPTGPVHWQSTVYGNAPQLRSNSAASSLYTHSELKQTVQQLQETVESSCDSSSKWTLRIYLQELLNGALAIEVSGRSHNPSETSKTWEKSFQSLESFQEKVPMFGKQIADEL